MSESLGFQTAWEFSDHFKNFLNYSWPFSSSNATSLFIKWRKLEHFTHNPIIIRLATTILTVKSFLIAHFLNQSEQLRMKTIYLICLAFIFSFFNLFLDFVTIIFNVLCPKVWIIVMPNNFQPLNFLAILVTPLLTIINIYTLQQHRVRI